jgi:hypothetical protein
MKACTCATSYANTGKPDCTVELKDTRKLIVVPTYGSAGTLNKIATGNILNASYFTGKYNAADPLDRWYPLPLLEYVEDTKAEINYETPPSGTTYPISEGIRSFKASFMFGDTIFLTKLNAFNCNDISVFEIDSDSNIIGKTDETDFYPRKVSSKTFATMLMRAKAKTEKEKINIMFDFDITEDDEDIRVITSTEAGADLLLAEGLLDTNIAISAVLATSFTATMTMDYGTFKTATPDIGHVKADFALVKNGGAAVTITSITEGVDGVYAFVVPSCTGAHTLTFSKTGWEITTATVTFP